MGVFELRKIVLAISLALVTLVAGGPARSQQAGQQTIAQQAIPDAPRPQPTISPGTVAPGQGSSSAQENDATPEAPAAPTPAAARRTRKHPPPGDPARCGAGAAIATLHTRVDLVQVPFTVKNGKTLVAGLHARDIQVYENGVRQQLRYFRSEEH